MGLFIALEIIGVAALFHWVTAISWASCLAWALFCCAAGNFSVNVERERRREREDASRARVRVEDLRP